MTARRLIKRRTVIVGAAALSCAKAAAQPPSSKRPLRIRAATDVNSQHILTRTLDAYLSALKQTFPEDIEVELFHSGQLYSDRDLARALYRGDLDLAAPTITSLSRLVPECSITSLPPFFGQPAEATHHVLDSDVGEDINRRLEAKLNGVVAGRYVDLGHVDLFCLSPAQTYQSLADMKIRVPSGAANVFRLRALGAYPVVMPFADVPVALSQHAVDALESTAETVRTTQLWDSGLRLCIRDQAYFFQYVPIISGRLWRRASPPLREALTGLWHDTIAGNRKAAADRQQDARQVCADNGIEFRIPDEDVIRRSRAQLEPITKKIIRKLSIDPELAARAVSLIS